MSTTRRVFLQSAALGLMAMPVFAADTRRLDLGGLTGQIQFDLIFVDARRAQALAFGEAARQMGARTQAISGAIEDPCYDYVQRRWRIAKMPIAGMTDFRTLSLLQVMASDAGLRTVLCMHRLQSPESLHWNRAAARLVLSLRENEFDEVDRTGIDAANQVALDSRSLVAWAIA